jgi:hypothetical protein
MCTDEYYYLLKFAFTFSQDRCERRPWLIDPSPGHYLYLQIRGSIIKEPDLDNFTLLNNITVAPDLRHLCRTQNRIAIYTGGLSPVFICPDPPDEQVRNFKVEYSIKIESRVVSEIERKDCTSLFLPWMS